MSCLPPARLEVTLLTVGPGAALRKASGTPSISRTRFVKPAARGRTPLPRALVPPQTGSRGAGLSKGRAWDQKGTGTLCGPQS